MSALFLLTGPMTDEDIKPMVKEFKKLSQDLTAGHAVVMNQPPIDNITKDDDTEFPNEQSTQ
jgi:hypothetical protein